MILGGRQPARAIDHLSSVRAGGVAAHGLCILDRDLDEEPLADAERALSFFVWSRRHIESYLLQPAAILRSSGLEDRDGRLRRALIELLPDPDDETQLRQIDAKALLAPRGPVAHRLGVEPSASRIARSMRDAELHPDVLELLERLEAMFGLVAPEVTSRHRPRPRGGVAG